mmetsp:Transcript_17962/g.26038  ORF Transcript_17962/g.26038 Transcript_17962/m.26038 type:complete len:90 (-) Transcript_17962:381-650(-)
MQSIRESGSSRLIDNTHDIQSSDTSRIFRSLTLLIIKMSGHSNHSLAHFHTQMLFGCKLQFTQYHGGYFFGVQLLRFTAPVYFNFGFSV